MTEKNVRKVLLIEDDPDIRFSVNLILELLNFEVSNAENGKVALELLAQNSMPDLILLDMLMPEMDGWHFAQEFHALYDHKAPILVMTAAPDPKQRAQDIEAEGYLSKPFSIDTLQAKIGALVV